jgi:hypothetical protein
MGLKGGILGTVVAAGHACATFTFSFPEPPPPPNLWSFYKYLTEGSRPRRGRRLLPIALAPHHKPCRRGPRVTPAAAIWSEPATHTLPNQNQLSPN